MMKQPVRFRAGVTLAALGLASALGFAACWSPVFDINVSTGAIIAKRLDEAGSVGPVVIDIDEWKDHFFVPARSPKPVDGYLVQIRDNDVRVGYFGHGYDKTIESFIPRVPGAPTKVASGPYLAPLPTFPYEAEATLLITGCNPNAAGSHASVYSVRTTLSDTMPPSVIPEFRVDYAATTFNPPYADGFSVGTSGTPPAAMPELRMSYVFTDSSVTPGSNSAATLVFSYGSMSTPGSPMTSLLAQTAAPLVSFGGYIGTDSAPSLTYTLSDDKVTFQQDYFAAVPAPFPPPRLLPVDHRIFAVLSDGTLLGKADGVLYVYDLDGKERFHVALGGLKYAHEVWDGSEWLCVFFLPLMVLKDGEDIYSITYRIYTVPTADLDRISRLF